MEPVRLTGVTAILVSMSKQTGEVVRYFAFNVYQACMEATLAALALVRRGLHNVSPESQFPSAALHFTSRSNVVPLYIDG